MNQCFLEKVYRLVPFNHESECAPRCPVSAFLQNETVAKRAKSRSGFLPWKTQTRPNLITKFGMLSQILAIREQKSSS